MRGTFANVRIKNLMVPGTEGGITIHQPSRRADAASTKPRCATSRTACRSVVFGGDEYGQGSSRDWAAKGPQLLGVKAVIVRNFERIHRANLVVHGRAAAASSRTAPARSRSKLDGSETIDLTGIENGITPMQDVTMVITRKDGKSRERAAAACASTRRSRSSTTSTAASCPTCCASCLAAQPDSA